MKVNSQSEISERVPFNSLISLCVFVWKSYHLLFLKKLSYAFARADGPILHLWKVEAKGNWSSLSTLMHTGWFHIITASTPGARKHPTWMAYLWAAQDLGQIQKRGQDKSTSLSFRSTQLLGWTQWLGNTAFQWQQCVLRIKNHRVYSISTRWCPFALRLKET